MTTAPAVNPAWEPVWIESWPAPVPASSNPGKHAMPHPPNKTITGTVTHIFGHRIVLKTGHGDVLADLTPRGLEQIVLRLNDDVILEGEMKPSEMKVVRLTRAGKTVVVDPKAKPHHDHHPHADPSIVLAAAHAVGFEVLRSPRRKPKHFEVLGKRKDELNELHIELDGHIRKSKPVASDDQKWSVELRSLT
jgi:hypothetical protein